MGFAGRVHDMTWPPGHDYAGMKVEIRAPSVETVNEMVEGRKDGESLKDATHRRFERLCEHLVSWNLERPDGSPFPTDDPVALVKFDAGAIAEIIEAWSDGGRVPDPSKQEDPETGGEREPIDPLDGTSERGLPTGASSEVEALIPTRDVP